MLMSLKSPCNVPRCLADLFKGKRESVHRWTWNHLSHKHLMQMATGHDVVVVEMATWTPFFKNCT